MIKVQCLLEKLAKISKRAHVPHCISVELLKGSYIRLDIEVKRLVRIFIIKKSLG